MRGRTPKTTKADWVGMARRTLIEEGISGVKVDRLAVRLGVTRGGFYHSFADRDELLKSLLDDWDRTCHFLPDEHPGTTPAEAVNWLERLSNRLIDEDGYDHEFDMAVREWARSDQRTAWAVERSDRQRMLILTRFFQALGYPEAEAEIRSCVFYYHQIGYYAIGVRETATERRRKAPIYLDILCGRDHLAAARPAEVRPVEATGRLQRRKA